MKQIIVFLIVLLPFISLAQLDGNTTLSYPELIKAYEDLAMKHKEIELFEMGDSDYGLPIYLCVINV